MSLEKNILNYIQELKIDKDWIANKVPVTSDDIQTVYTLGYIIHRLEMIMDIQNEE